jgi:hypothetical protein
MNIGEKIRNAREDMDLTQLPKDNEKSKGLGNLFVSFIIP